jgi:predicted nucleic acid-binding Zn ribbon protein
MTQCAAPGCTNIVEQRGNRPRKFCSRRCLDIYHQKKHRIERTTMKQVNLLRKAQCWSKKRAYTAPPPKHALVCQNCGNSFFASHSDAKFCSNDCRVTNWRYSGKMIVTARMVRQEEGLHDPRPHVCRFYAPAYKCICGKQGNGPARTYGLVTFQPAVSGD